MVKEEKVSKFICELCGAISFNKETAERCESRPISQDKGVKIGDIILITRGDGAGKRGKVDDIFVYDKDWGHYAWERYWHTVGVQAKLIDGIGSRQLKFDDYEVFDP